MNNKIILTKEYLEYLFKQQRENCLKEYKNYYAGSEEDFAPDCIIESILNAKKPKVKCLGIENFYLDFLEWYCHKSNMTNSGWSLTTVVKNYLKTAVKK